MKRYMKEERCHREFIVFEDGTEMEKDKAEAMG